MDKELTPRELKRIETDRKNIDATIEIIGNKGYVNSNLREIASAAGITQGLISQRFQTKENLLIQALLSTNVVWVKWDYPKDIKLEEILSEVIDKLKKIYKNDEKAFKFIYTVSSSLDIPEKVREKQKDFFLGSPICRLMKKGQEGGYLPKGDVAAMYNIFLSNALRLIRDYNAVGMEIPEDKYFMAAIQYRNPIEEEKEYLRGKAFESISQSFFSLIYFNIQKNTFSIARTIEKIEGLIDESTDSQGILNLICERFVAPEYHKGFLGFIDLTTVLSRIGDKKVIAYDFIGVNKHNYRISFIFIIKETKNEIVLCGIQEI